MQGRQARGVLGPPEAGRRHPAHAARRTAQGEDASLVGWLAFREAGGTWPDAAAALRRAAPHVILLLLPLRSR